MYEVVDPKSLPQLRQRQEARERDIRAEGYGGKTRWMVVNTRYGALHVYARDLVGAVWTAAKHWNVRPQSTEFHQNCRVTRA